MLHFEELCGYLGMGQGRVPEHASDLRVADWVRLCAALQRTRDEITAMAFLTRSIIPCDACRGMTSSIVQGALALIWFFGIGALRGR